MPTAYRSIMDRFADLSDLEYTEEISSPGVDVAVAAWRVRSADICFMDLAREEGPLDVLDRATAALLDRTYMRLGMLL